MADVLDYQCQHFLRKAIDELPTEQRNQLKSIRLCGQSVMKHLNRVYLIVNERGDVRYHGHTTCKNPFACPVCSARMMEKYRSKVAAAIDVLYKEYFGFMFTLTIPHWSFMTCRETMDILRDTWKYFRMSSFKGRSHGHVFHEFKSDVTIAHHVKVMEHTWGKNGWHPHYHGIMWTPRGNEGRVLDWEKKLSEFWIKAAKRVTLKYWKKNNLHQKVLLKGETYEQLIDRMYKLSDDCQVGLLFSKDKEGNLREVHTGDYICGWGADNEVTGNIGRKASKNGHYTPYQLLLNIDKPEFRKLYIDFCLAVTQKPVVHRVDFSQTGLVKMIEAYQKENGYETEVILKKAPEKSATNWKVLAFFDATQWYELSQMDRWEPVFAEILLVATQRRECLLEFIDSLLPGYSFAYDTLCEIFERDINHTA